jgi:hypothetical protein
MVHRPMLSSFQSEKSSLFTDFCNKLCDCKILFFSQLLFRQMDLFWQRQQIGDVTMSLNSKIRLFFCQKTPLN